MILSKKEYNLLKSMIISKSAQVYTTELKRECINDVNTYNYQLESFVSPNGKITKHVYTDILKFAIAIEGLNYNQVTSAAAEYFESEDRNINKYLEKLRIKQCLLKKTVRYKGAKEDTNIWVINDNPDSLLVIFNEFKARNELSILLKSYFYNRQTFLSDFLLTIGATSRPSQKIIKKSDMIKEKKINLKEKTPDIRIILESIMLPPSFIINFLGAIKEFGNVVKLRQFYYTSISQHLISLLKYAYFADIYNEEYKDIHDELRKNYEKIKDYY